MALIAALFGLLIVCLGTVGIVSPPRLVSMVAGLQSTGGLYAIVALRLVSGTALFLAADESRAPGFLHVLGVLAIISGLVTPFFGVDRFRAILDWWSRQSDLLLRAWACVVVALGLTVLWAVAP